MTKPARRRVAMALFGGVAALAVAGCGGGSDFKDKPRPAVPIQLTSAITDKAVSIEPSKVGAGPVTIIFDNLSSQSHTIKIEGGPHNTREQVGPINPQDVAQIQESLEPGTYTVTAGSDQASAQAIRSATIQVGPRRKSSSNKTLLP